MLRLILLIILFSTLGTTLTGSYLFFFKYGSVQLFVQDEEAKNDKTDQKAAKDDSDKLHAYYPVCYSSLYGSEIATAPIKHERPYHSFHQQPSSPPPDLI